MLPQIKALIKKYGIIVGFFAGITGGAGWAVIQTFEDTAYRWFHPAEVRFASELAPGLLSTQQILDEELSDLNDKFCSKFPEDCQ